MQIAPFKVEQWMNVWETRCTYNLAETCVHSLTLEALLALAGQNQPDLNTLLPMKMTYGDIEGSDRLRAGIAALYAGAQPAQVTVTHGTIAANMLVHKALVSAGDRVIAIVPSYQQHYSIPDSIGADVHLLPLRAEDGFLPDLDRLRALAVPGTRLIALTNPNNPTGALIPQAMLEETAQIAEGAGAYVLCDEVYRGTAQSGDGMSPSMADLYRRGISTGGLSKAFSLAGLRVGWAVASDEVTERLLIHRDYDTIAVGRLNDHLAALALEAADRILARSRAITRTNLALVDAFVAAQPRLDWVRPQAGTTGMLRLETAQTDRAFCLDLLDKTGVMLTPGDAFEMPGYARIGFANPEPDLRAGLAALGDYLAHAD